jgi:hypothetical protein
MIGPVKVLPGRFFMYCLLSGEAPSGGEDNVRRWVVATVDQTDMRGLGTA